MVLWRHNSSSNSNSIKNKIVLQKWSINELTVNIFEKLKMLFDSTHPSRKFEPSTMNFQWREVRKKYFWSLILNKWKICKDRPRFLSLILARCYSYDALTSDRSDLAILSKLCYDLPQLYYLLHAFRCIMTSSHQ